MTSSNRSIFRVTGPLCGEFIGPGEFPAQRPVTRSFDVFFHLRLNKRLSKQPRGWWFETPSWSLWRHRNELTRSRDIYWPFETGRDVRDRDTCSYKAISVRCEHFTMAIRKMNHIDGLVQERRNSSALAMDLRLSRSNSSIWYLSFR